MLSSLSLDDISNIPLQQVGADVATCDVNFHKNSPPLFSPLSPSLSLFSLVICWSLKLSRAALRTY